MELLGSLPTALIPVALVLYFSDQNTKNWMTERKEIVLAILSERKEWEKQRENILERQFTMQERTMVEIAGIKAEYHVFRGALQENNARLESLALHVQAVSKGNSGDD